MSHQDHVGQTETAEDRLARFAFRGRRPALLARLESKAARAETRDAGQASCMKADATLA